MIYFPLDNSSEIDKSSEIIIKNYDSIYLKVGADLVIDNDFVNQEWTVNESGGFVRLSRKNGLEPGHNAILMIADGIIQKQHSFFVKNTISLSVKKAEVKQFFDFIPDLFFSEKLYCKNKDLFFTKSNGKLVVYKMDDFPKDIYLTKDNCIIVLYGNNEVKINIGLPFWLAVKPSIQGRSMFSDSLIVTYNTSEISVIVDYRSKAKEIIWNKEDIDEIRISDIQIEDNLILVNKTKVLSSWPIVNYTKIS